MLTIIINYRKQITSSTNKRKMGSAGIDHILEAQQMGEINEDNVRYIIENMNIAGKVIYK